MAKRIIGPSNDAGRRSLRLLVSQPGARGGVHESSAASIGLGAVHSRSDDLDKEA